MDYYTLDRKSVAEMLKISTRTVDRYAAKKLFSIQRKKGKIFFHQKEVEGYLLSKNTESVDISTTDQTTRLRQIQENYGSQTIDDEPLNPLSESVSKFKQIEKISRAEKYIKKELETEMYKNMYKTTQKLFQSQQKQLRDAYYRIGQLETQVKPLTVQLPESTKNLVSKEKYEEKKQVVTHLQQHLKQTELEHSLLQKKLYNAQVLKLFFLISTISVIFIFSVVFSML
jgi:hypothetical protein